MQLIESIYTSSKQQKTITRYLVNEHKVKIRDEDVSPSSHPWEYPILHWRGAGNIKISPISQCLAFFSMSIDFPQK